MPKGARTADRFAEVLPRLLEDREISQRSLARTLGVSQAHLSRLSGSAATQAPSPKLAAAVAEALGLPAGYFVESRRAAVIEAIDRDTAVLDRLYALVTRGS